MAARIAGAAAGEAAGHWVFGPHTRLLDGQRSVALVKSLRDVEKSVRNLVLRPIRQLGVDGR